jgi:hypothetical protein
VVMEGEESAVAPPEAAREAEALLETGEGDWAPRPAHSG